MSILTDPKKCPSWCGSDHTAGPGSMHRGEIGTTIVGGKRITVVLLQTPDGDPTVGISGPRYVGVDDLDHEAMAELLDLCGQRRLGALVRRAASVRAAELLKETGQ